MSMHNPPHPVEFIQEIYMEPFGITGRQLAAKLDVATSTLNRILNTGEQQNANDKDYDADDANSNIQNGVTKSGWCLIGEDRHFRSCMEVGVNDKCMSGDIFPSREICVNPSLRP